MKSLLTVLLAIGLLTGMNNSVASQTIKLATLAPEGSPWHQMLQDMAKAWSEVSEGRIKLRIYPGGVAGDEPDVVRKMRVGQLHAAALTGRGLTVIADEIQALQMPLMFHSDAELEYVRKRVSPKLSSILEDKGFKLLVWGDAGWVRFFTQEPVVRPEDLKPLKLFIWSQNTTYIEAWKDAGFHPVPLAATDIHAALQSGMINVFTTTPVAALSFQWFGLANHMTDLKWAPLVGAIVVSTETWRKIPEALRAQLIEEAKKASKRVHERLSNFDNEAIEIMKNYGLVVHQVPPEVVAEWEKSVRAGYPRIVGNLVPADIVAEVERLRAEFRSMKER
jgi:TRAP-type C4-dicarboxylate transport system substrate-binding protein